MSALQFGEEMGKLGEFVAGEVWRERGGMRGEVEMVGPQLEVLLEVLLED